MTSLAHHGGAPAAPRSSRRRPLRLAGGLALAAATLAGCGGSIKATGPGSLLEEKVAEAMLAPWPGGEAHPVGPLEMMQDATRNWDPSQGRLAFVVQEGGFTGPETCVEVSISPWDEQAGVERTIRVAAWHWNFFPPMTKGPVPSIQREAIERIRRAVGGS